jgi:hypothetical protein
MSRLACIAFACLMIAGCSQPRASSAATAPSSAEGQSTPTPRSTAEAPDTKPQTPEAKAEVQANPKPLAPDSIKVGADAVTEKDLGVSFYPGSKVSAKGSARSMANGQETMISTRTTPDSPSQVSAFYKPLFVNPSAFQGSMNMEEMCSISSFLANGDEISIVARRPQGEDTVIVISRKKS